MSEREGVSLWMFVLRCRDAFLLAVIGVALLSPAAGRERFGVVAVLALVVLPYNAWLKRRTKDDGAVPRLMAYADPLLCAGIAGVFPAALAAAMIAGIMDLAIAATTFPRRTALAAAGIGSAAFTAAGVIDLLNRADVAGAALAVPAYAVASVTTALMVSAIVQQERLSRRQLGTVVERLGVVAFETDARTHRTRWVTDNIEQVTGRSRHLWFADPPPDRSLLHPEDAERVAGTYHRVVVEGGSAEVEYRLGDDGQPPRWVHTWMTADVDEAGQAMVRGILVDVSDRKAMEDELTRRALHDDLTGLPNRALLLERATQALEALRSDDAPGRREGDVGPGESSGVVAVVFADLAQFKRVNDSLGHAAGDALLQAFGRRLTELIGPGDTVARFGGDEFVVLARLDSADDVPDLVGRLLTAFDAPIPVDGRDLMLSGRFGAVLTANPDDDTDRLLVAANVAMHSAKQSGLRWVLYDPELHRRQRERAALEAQLGDALAAGELRLHYQPIVESRTMRPVAVEALLRWQHPQRGLLSPAAFLDLAEATGHVLPLGRWALEEGCRQLATWRAAGLLDLRLNVNLSATQLVDPDLVATVHAALRRSEVPADRLCLEITETALIADPVAAAETLTGLALAGVQLALDDFGTGYSSLTHLREFPVTTMKVDRSFAAGILRSPDDLGIVRSINSMADHLGLSVVAEGVETAAQAVRLAELGCGYLQGYLVSRPLPADEVTLLLDRPCLVT